MTGAAATVLIDDDVALDFFTALHELEVEDDHRLGAICRIKLAIDRGQGGLWNFLDDERTKLWRRLKISVKVAGGETELFRGYITEISMHFGFDEAMPLLAITGLDETCLMTLEDKIKDWISRSDSDIAREVFQSYRLKAEVEDTNIVHQESASTIIQRETDIQFLKRLARRNGFECFVRGGTGYFRKPSMDAKPQPVLAAQFGSETNLLNLDLRVEALRPTGVELHQLDTISKELQDSVIETSEQRQLGRIGAHSLNPPNGIKSRMVIKHSVATGRPQMDRLGLAVFEESAWFIEARGEIDGDLYDAVLCARDLVPIKGTGEMFSGVYFVTRVRHIFKPEKYVQEFRARRNAMAPSDSDDFSAGTARCRGLA